MYRSENHRGPAQPRPAAAATPMADTLRRVVLMHLSGLEGDARGRMAYALEGHVLRASAYELETADLIAVTKLAGWLADQRREAYSK